MKQIPMIFNQEMAYNVLKGRKTITRRPIKFPVSFSENSGFNYTDKKGKKFSFGIGFDEKSTMMNFINAKSPFNKGDLIWVRETFRYFNRSEECSCYESCSCPLDGTTLYKVSNSCDEARWIPSIHMPKSASRLTLKIKNVTIEKIQDISEDHAIKEGYPENESLSPVEWYQILWDSIYGDWDENNYVWVIEFETIEKNISDLI